MCKNCINKAKYLKAFLIVIIAIFTTQDLFAQQKLSKNPNIVFIFADDMGWGLIQAYNHSSIIPTPNLNALAEEGMRFTNAHANSSVCTPSRYSLLTGRYPWRTRLKQGVLYPPSKPLINKNQLTLGSLLKKEGYYTAIVGKWHLGLSWAFKDSVPNKFSPSIHHGPRTRRDSSIRHIPYNFNEPIRHGPNSLGFDYSYIVPGSLDMFPHCYIKNGHVVKKPTVFTKNRFGEMGYEAPGWNPEKVQPHLTQTAVNTINKHARSKQKGKGQPLFLYFALTAPHNPVVPSKQFQGKTQMGKFGDFVYQVDWVVGRIIKTLKANHMYNNTLLIFSADNGTAPNSLARVAMTNGQDLNGPLRGNKGDIWEGGSRIPFIARWPGHIPAGTTQNELISLSDMMATVSTVTGDTLKSNAGVDSYNILPALQQPNIEYPLRDVVVVQSIAGYFGVLQGPWKGAFVAGSGGWSHPKTKEAIKRGLPRIQLYNLSMDLSETRNIKDQHESIVWMLRHLLLHYIDQGRSTPGQKQQNWKGRNRWKQVSDWVIKK